MFVAPDDFPIPASLRESDASFERQQALRREVMTDRVVASFASPSSSLAPSPRRCSSGTKSSDGLSTRRLAPESRSRPAAAPQAEKRSARTPTGGLSVPQGRRRSVLRARGAGRSALGGVPRSFTRPRADGEAPTRLLAILGPSGSGKSRSRRRGCWPSWTSAFAGPPGAARVVFTPEARPLESLAVALARQATSDPAPAQKAMRVRGDPARAREATTACAFSPSGCWTWAAAA